MSLRITIIGINFFPEQTGCGPYTTDLAKSLVSQGHSVRVLTGLPHYPHWKTNPVYVKGLYFEEKFDGIEIRRFWHHVPKKYSTFGRILYELTFCFHVVARVRKDNADVVIAVSPSLMSVVAGKLIRRNEAKLKVLVQDLVAAASKQTSGKFKGLIERITFLIEKKALVNADNVGVISNGFVKYLEMCGVDAKRISVTENYSLIPLEKVPYVQARRQWGWTESQKIVLYTGSFGRKQNLENLIEAAKHLESMDSHVRVILFGDGNAKHELEVKARNSQNVEIRDLVPFEEYMSLLCSADILISHEGNFEQEMSVPSKLTSYISSGSPVLVVCSQSSSTFSKVLEYSLNHCEPGNPRALSEKITTMLNNQRSKVQANQYEQSKRSTRINWATSL